MCEHELVTAEEHHVRVHVLVVSHKKQIQVERIHLVVTEKLRHFYVARQQGAVQQQ